MVWQVPCAASGDWYGGQLVVKGDAYKTDGSWLRLQLLQVSGPGSAAAVAMRTSGAQARQPVSVSLSPGKPTLITWQDKPLSLGRPLVLLDRAWRKNRDSFCGYQRAQHAHAQGSDGWVPLMRTWGASWEIVDGPQAPLDFLFSLNSGQQLEARQVHLTCKQRKLQHLQQGDKAELEPIVLLLLRCCREVIPQAGATGLFPTGVQFNLSAQPAPLLSFAPASAPSLAPQPGLALPPQHNLLLTGAQPLHSVPQAAPARKPIPAQQLGPALPPTQKPRPINAPPQYRIPPPAAGSNASLPAAPAAALLGQVSLSRHALSALVVRRSHLLSSLPSVRACPDRAGDPERRCRDASGTSCAPNAAAPCRGRCPRAAAAPLELPHALCLHASGLGACPCHACKLQRVAAHQGRPCTQTCCLRHKPCSSHCWRGCSWRCFCSHAARLCALCA